jgi:hypothetical protein
MPSRLDVRLVGKAPVLKFHMCMLRLSYISRFRKVLYKFNVLASTQVMCNIMVCKCKVEPIGKCVLESKFKPKIILF